MSICEFATSFYGELIVGCYGNYKEVNGILVEAENKEDAELIGVPVKWQGDDCYGWSVVDADNDIDALKERKAEYMDYSEDCIDADVIAKFDYAIKQAEANA
jgi:hypothetical protein